MKNTLKETIAYILVIVLIVVSVFCVGIKIEELKSRIKLYEDKLNEIDSIYQQEINETIQTYEKLLEVCE